MSYDGPTPTKFGRYAVAEPFRAATLHLHTGADLKTVDHEPPMPVLDQEDLEEQGIDTASLIKGAQEVDALGSCTCNAGTVSLAERWVAAGRSLSEIQLNGSLVGPLSLGGTAVADEEFAILLYYLVTHQTGDPAQEWPPTDCGSTGLYVCSELESAGLIASHKSTSGITNLVSLLQDGTVIQGGPFFNSWMTPDRLGFVDGDGDIDDLYDAVRSGVAGGHETCITAVESLHLDLLGRVDGDKTVIRVRNSWSSSWGDNGSFRMHLSTLELLGHYFDFKQFVVGN